MSFDEYKNIHVLFTHENPKSQLSLEIKTNTTNEQDVKIKLKFLYEFNLKEFDNNSLILVFEIEGDSLTNKITNNFNYYIENISDIGRPPPPQPLPSLNITNEMLNARRDVIYEDENIILNAKRDKIQSDKLENNEMIKSRKELLKKDRYNENETNLMMNSKKYYIQFDKITNKKKNVDIPPESTDKNNEEINSIVNNLIQNMNKFKYTINEFNENKENNVKIELNEEPIKEYITPTSSPSSNITLSNHEGDEIKSDNGSVESVNKKYKIKLDSDEKLDIKNVKIKNMNVEDKLLKLLNETNENGENSDEISIQKRLNYQLRLSTAMNNISPTKNIIFIVTELMKYIDNFELKGEDKKTLIISSVKSFLTSEKVDDPTIKFIVNTVCPELIDILISVDKRNITIRKKIACFFPFCS